VYSAWEYLAKQPTSNSPYTTKPWRSTESIREFSFPSCISDYSHNAFVQEIETCLTNGVRPNLTNSLNSQEDLADFPNQAEQLEAQDDLEQHEDIEAEQANVIFPNPADQQRVAQGVGNIIARISNAAIQGGLQYYEFSQQHRDIHASINSLAGGEVKGFVLGTTLFALANHTEIGRYVQHQVGSYLRQQAENRERQEAEARAASERQEAEARAARERQKAEARAARERQAHEPIGCWSCVKRVVTRFFANDDNAVENEIEN